LNSGAAPHTILVLGGYGFFGRRICHALAANPPIRLLIAGRDRAQALRLAAELGLPDAQAVAIDATTRDLAEQLCGVTQNMKIVTSS